MANACGRALRRTIPAAAGIAVVAAVGGTAWAGYRFVTTSSRFAITELVVRGNHHLTVDQVRAAVPAHLGDNMFATSLDTLVRGLRGEPWIAEAEAHRILPHTIVIDVREHVAAAVAELDARYLVDADGHPFKRAVTDDDGAGLPIVTGLDRAAYLADPEATAAVVRGALAALATWHTGARPAIGEVHVDPHGALVLHTADRATAVYLGVRSESAPLQLGLGVRSESAPLQLGLGVRGEPAPLQLGQAPQSELAARIRTFDAVWAALTDADRARTRAIHLDARPDHVTVAFSKD